MGWKSKSDNAKKLHRPSHKNWDCDGFYKTFPPFASTFLSPDQSTSQSQSQSQSDDDGNLYRGHTDLPTGDEYFLPFGQATQYHDEDTNVSTTDMTNRHKTNINITTSKAITPLPIRFDAKTVSPYEFHNRYEEKYLPCVITNIPQGHDIPPPPPPRGHHRFSDGDEDEEKHQGEEKKCCEGVGGDVRNHTACNNMHDHKAGGKGSETRNSSYYNVGEVDTTIHAWDALERWSLDALMEDDLMRERTFKCGEDDDGNNIRLKLKHFLKYLHKNRDDSPLYVFHSSFDEDRIARRLLSDYRVPTYFNEDLFQLVGERRRPPHRWFLIGPRRSGTCVHIDPLATSAWNTLIHGTKRWVIFPPNVPKSLVKGRGYIKKGEDDEAIHYFTTILPRIKRAAAQHKAAMTNDHNDTIHNTTKFKNFECYEFTQNAGETVYIPGGWWHAVINLTDTVGITQNFCSHRNFHDVWLKTRTGRKKMAYKWLCQLDVHYPHLAKRARDLNARDGFVMKYEPKEGEGNEKKYGADEERHTDRDVKRSRVERVVLFEELIPIPYVNPNTNK